MKIKNYLLILFLILVQNNLFAQVKNGLASGNCFDWRVQVKVTATNDCGTTTIYKDITPPAASPCGKILIQNQKFVINPCKGSFAKSVLIYNFKAENYGKLLILLLNTC